MKELSLIFDLFIKSGLFTPNFEIGEKDGKFLYLFTLSILLLYWFLTDAPINELLFCDFIAACDI